MTAALQAGLPLADTAAGLATRLPTKWATIWPTC